MQIVSNWAVGLAFAGPGMPLPVYCGDERSLPFNKTGRSRRRPSPACKEVIYAPLEGAAVIPRLREVSCETVSTLPPFAPTVPGLATSPVGPDRCPLRQSSTIGWTRPPKKCAPVLGRGQAQSFIVSRARRAGNPSMGGQVTAEGSGIGFVDVCKAKASGSRGLLATRRPGF